MPYLNGNSQYRRDDIKSFPRLLLLIHDCGIRDPAVGICEDLGNVGHQDIGV